MSIHKTTVLLSELKAIKTFASIDSSRFVLIGVSCEIHKDKTLLVATDGRRLAVLRSLSMPSDSAPVRFVIPSHLLARMTHAKRKAKPGENDVLIEHDTESRAVSLRHPSRDYTITGKSLEASFPEWRKVIPEPSASATRCRSFCRSRGIHGWIKSTYFGCVSIFQTGGAGLRRRPLFIGAAPTRLQRH